MVQKVGVSENVGVVGHHKPPCKISAESQVQAEGQPSLSGHGCAVGNAEIVINAPLALWNYLAGKQAEVGARVNQQQQLTGLVGKENAAGGCSADVRSR